MPPKHVIYLGIFIGSTLGSLVAMKFNIDTFSEVGLLFNAVGSFLGFFISYNLVKVR